MFQGETFEGLCFGPDFCGYIVIYQPVSNLSHLFHQVEE